MCINNNQMRLKKAFFNSVRNFISILPMMFAIIGLVALFQYYVTAEMISKLFGYSQFSDILTGTFVGAIANGHGSMSFIIAKGLQQEGVSIYALSTFTLAWVSLGFIQLPAEISVFGIRFTAIRNILAIFSTIFVTYFTILTMGLFI